jgi:hypothetical protein
MEVENKRGRLKRGSKKSQKKGKQTAGPLRFFYCLPIGPMASSVLASHRNREEPEEPEGTEKNKENDGR